MVCALGPWLLTAATLASRPNCWPGSRATAQLTLAVSVAPGIVGRLLGWWPSTHTWYCLLLLFTDNSLLEGTGKGYPFNLLLLHANSHYFKSRRCHYLGFLDSYYKL
jgi:hypothetical protein